MIKTYDRTMFISNEELQKCTVRLYVTKYVKYNRDNEEEEITFTGLVSWSIIGDSDAADLEREFNLSDEEKDEYQEYLVLEFNDGTKKVFRNSHTDMFLR